MTRTAVLLLFLLVAGVAYAIVGPDGISTSDLDLVQADGTEAQSAKNQRQSRPSSAAATTRMAQAQPAPAPQNPAPAAAPQAAPATAPEATPVVDETALRYFAQRGDRRRLEAEIARLRALYPNWTPPSDPLAVPANGDPLLDQMWRLYSEGKPAEVRKAIADRQAADPSWQPPQDLLDRLAISEGRFRLVNASDLKQYETVLRVATDFPSLLTCADVDVLWRVAEAFASTDKPDRAKAAYLYVLRNCDNPGERLATIEKAIPLVSPEVMDELLATERVGADGIGEFTPAKINLARHNVGQAGKDSKFRVRPGDLEMLEAENRRAPKASDDLILGWYYLQRNDAKTAADWFARANEAEPSVNAAQGQGLALVRLDRPAEAEELLYRYRDENPEIKAAYLAAVTNMLATEPRLDLSVQILQRIVPVIYENKAEAAAQQMGWYARAYDQHETAARWFGQALRWDSNDEAAAYGLALCLWQLGDRAGTTEIQRIWAGRSERIAAIGEGQKNGPSQSGQIPTPATPVPLAAPPAGQIIAPSYAPVAPQAPGTTTLQTYPNEPAGRPERTAEPSPQNEPRDPSQYVPAEVGDRTATTGGTRRVACRSTSYANANPQTSLARGWCLMDINRPIEAAKAFEAALASNNRRIREQAAWGQSLAYLRANLTDQAAVAASKAPQPARRKIELEASILSQRAASFFEAERYNETLLVLDQRARIANERRDLMILRGYAYFHLSRMDEARQVFEALAATGDRNGIRGLAAVNSSRRP